MSDATMAADVGALQLADVPSAAVAPSERARLDAERDEQLARWSSERVKALSSASVSSTATMQ
eukprot:9269383-Lingulodinium_polyedra.AAC.1